MTFAEQLIATSRRLHADAKRLPRGRGLHEVRLQLRMLSDGIAEMAGRVEAVAPGLELPPSIDVAQALRIVDAPAPEPREVAR